MLFPDLGSTEPQPFLNSPSFLMNIFMANPANASPTMAMVINMSLIMTIDIKFVYCKFKNDHLKKSFVKVFINNQYHNRFRKKMFNFWSFYFEVLPYLKFEISIKKEKSIGCEKISCKKNLRSNTILNKKARFWLN